MSVAQSVEVGLGARSYFVRIGEGLLATLPQRLTELGKHTRYFLLADEAVHALVGERILASLHAANFTVSPLLIPSGEHSKSFAQLQRLLEAMLAEQPDRKCCILALGGGVVGDLAGLAASLLLRGVDFVQLPTTLLAAVDSSVGGKTAVNSPQGKNLVGAFWQPRLVVADLSTLATLPPRELHAGYAEVVKYGALGNAAFFDWLDVYGVSALNGDMDHLVQMVAHCVRMKADIVGEDEREAGKRALLNLGHTMGHAFEAECGFSGELLHGEAVALGMVFAFRLAAAMGWALAQEGEKLVRHLARVNLPTHPRAIRTQWDQAALLRHCYGDKKAEGGKLTFILPRAIGACEVVKDVPAAAVEAALAAWLAEHPQ